VPSNEPPDRSPLTATHLDRLIALLLENQTIDGNEVYAAMNHDPLPQPEALEAPILNGQIFGSLYLAPTCTGNGIPHPCLAESKRRRSELPRSIDASARMGSRSARNGGIDISRAGVPTSNCQSRQPAVDNSRTRRVLGIEDLSSPLKEGGRMIPVPRICRDVTPAATSSSTDQ
jgi:hypothetical protein